MALSAWRRTINVLSGRRLILCRTVRRGRSIVIRIQYGHRLSFTGACNTTRRPDNYNCNGTRCGNEIRCSTIAVGHVTRNEKRVNIEKMYRNRARRGKKTKQRGGRFVGENYFLRN